MYHQDSHWNDPGPGHTIQIKEASRMPWLLLVLVLAGAGAAGYWGYQERARLLARVNAAEGAASHSDASLKALEDQVKKLEADRAALSKSVEEKSTELSTLKGTYDKLQDKMKDEIARGDVELVASGGRLRVDLVDKVLF